jgi:sec-independent protein translocase protein TatA
MNQNFPLAFLAGSLGAGEVILVLLLALVLFGPKRLPELMRSFGKTVGELRRISKGFQDQLVAMDQPSALINDNPAYKKSLPAVPEPPPASGNQSAQDLTPAGVEPPATAGKTPAPGDDPHDIAG